MLITPNKKKKMHKVLLLSKLYLNCIGNRKLSDDHKHFESEIMRVIAYIVFPSYLQFLYFIVLVKRYSFHFFTLVRPFERKINTPSYAKEKELVLYDSKKQVLFKRKLPNI
jgi:hypothetical protein